MSVVVSDTSPLHYLILCGAEEILPRLFGQVLIPPTVFRELQHANTPVSVKQWAGSLQQSNARLDSELIIAALARDKARPQAQK